MKLIDIKCPNCGSSIKLEKIDDIAKCPSCNTYFYIDKEEQVPHTVNININNYEKVEKKTEESTDNFFVLRILLIIALFLIYCFLKFPRAEKVNHDYYKYLEIPQSKPFTEFVYKLYGQEADNISKADYAKLSYLMIDKDENNNESPWIFSYSDEIDSYGNPIDEKKIIVDGNNSLQIKDFQAFTGLESLGYGSKGMFNWSNDSPESEINLKNLTHLKYFKSMSQSFSNIKNSFADPSAILGLTLSSISDVSGQDLEAFSNLKYLNLNGVWRKEDEQTYLQYLSSLKNLEELNLSFYFKSIDLNFLSSLNKLKKLEISNKDSDGKVNGLESLYTLSKLEILNLDGIKQVKLLDFVKNMPLLHSLKVTNCNISSIEPLRNNLAITDLHLEGMSNTLSDLSALVTLKSLKNLYINGTTLERGDMPNLSGLVNLKNLAIETAHTQAIKDMSKLEKLTLIRGRYFEPNELSGLVGLKEFTMKSIDLERNIFNVIASLPELKKADFFVGSIRVDISPIFKSKSIEELKFHSSAFDEGHTYLSIKNMPVNNHIKKFQMNNYMINNVDNSDYKPLGDFSNNFLSHLKAVEELEIRSNQINDLNFVKQMPNLRVLDISDNYVKDIGVLTTCTKLQKFICNDNPIVNYSVLSENVEVVK